jgi:hypothetical protein
MKKLRVVNSADKRGTSALSVGVEGNAPALGLAESADLTAGVAGALVDAATLAIVMASLSSYQRILVVDPDGHGDATTLSGALALVSGAGSSARFGIMVFGRVVETVNCSCPAYVDIWGAPGSQITFTGAVSFQVAATVSGQGQPMYRDLYFHASGGDVTLAANSRATFVNCKVGGDLVPANGAIAKFYLCDFATALDDASTTATLEFYECSLPLCTLNGATVKARRCTFTSNATPAINIDGATVELIDCTVTCTATGSDAHAIDFVSGSLTINYCAVVSKGALTSAGMAVVAGATLYGIGSTFEGGGAGLAVMGTTALTDVPLYHCVFVGGVTDITCDAGTANGTSVSI